MPFVWLLASAALQLVGYLIMPKSNPKSESKKPEKMENPTAEAGKPIPRIFGEITIEDPNILWYGDKQTGEYEVKA